ncbi:MAG: RNA polymerase sigma factor [Candidatus Hydrogenedentes bacterium]|nr:RNA polymerase sigma factor [Candidatus Hydrogenedentota bacterium]
MLYKRMCAGDIAAFEQFCLPVERPLLAYAARIVPPVEAEDLAQEALCRLFRLVRKGSLDPGKTSPRSLLFTIAHNLAMDFHRKSRREMDTSAENSAPAASSDVERQFLRHEIDKAVAQLPETQRQALLLREYGGMTYDEIAQTMGVDLNNIRIWIYRARKRLATLLDRDGQFVGQPSERQAP